MLLARPLQAVAASALAMPLGLLLTLLALQRRLLNRVELSLRLHEQLSDLLRGLLLGPELLVLDGHRLLQNVVLLLEPPVVLVPLVRGLGPAQALREGTEVMMMMMMMMVLVILAPF